MAIQSCGKEESVSVLFCIYLTGGAAVDAATVSLGLPRSEGGVYSGHCLLLGSLISLGDKQFLC